MSQIPECIKAEIEIISKASEETISQFERDGNQLYANLVRGCKIKTENIV